LTDAVKLANSHKIEKKTRSEMLTIQHFAAGRT